MSLSLSLRLSGNLFKVLCKARIKLLCHNNSLFSFNSCRGVLTYQQIPRPPKIPIVGSLPYFLKAGGQKQLHKYVDKHHKSLGSIFVDNFGGPDMLFISDPDATAKLFASEGKYPEHFVPDPWKLFLQETGRKRGLFFMDGEEWLQARSVLNRLMLRPKSMTTHHVEGIAEICKEFMEVWKTNPPNNLEYQIYCWNVECVSDIIISKRLGFLKHLKQFDTTNATDFPDDEFTKAIYNIFLESANLYAWPAKLAKNLRLKSWKNFHFSVTTALNKGENYIREAIKECKENPSEKMKQSVLYKILEEKSLDEDTITHIFIDLILASVDTTSQTASWSLYLLGKNPEVAEKARKEIFSVLAQEKSLTLETINKMQYINGIIREALRLYPPAIFLTRRLPEETDLNGYVIPAGTMVISSLYSMGTNSTNFTDPEEFKPERWFRVRNQNNCPVNNTVHVRQAYIPWAIGGRSCVGRRVAELDLSLLLIEALKTFEWTVEEEVDSILRLVPVPSKELKLKLKPL